MDQFLVYLYDIDIKISKKKEIKYLHFNIRTQLNVFVALAPAAKARGLQQGMLQTFIHMAPQSLFLAFGEIPKKEKNGEKYRQMKVRRPQTANSYLDLNS